MASLVLLRCHSCGKHHEFCHPDKDLEADKETYQYICPVSGSPAQIEPSKWDRSGVPTPYGMVVVKSLPKQEA